MLLHEFLADHRVDLIARCRAKVVKHAHCATAEQLQNGVPMLLEQLVQTLRSEQERCGRDSPVSQCAVSESATLHGQDMLELGYTVDKVLRNCGDLCQSN